MPPVSPNIRSGSAAQLLRQVGDMSGNVPALAYAHVPIYTISPKFRPSKFITPIAEEGELAMAFHLSDRQHGTSDFTTGGGLRLMNWHLALLTLSPDQFFKEGFEAAASDLRLLQLDDPRKIADICALLGPVYIPEQGAARVLKPKPINPAEFIVQVFGLAEGQSMKDIWPDAPVDSQLFLELREVQFDRNTAFHFAKPLTKPLKLEESVFPNGRPKTTYQFVPTFIPPSLNDYMQNHATKDAYANRDNYKVPVGSYFTGKMATIGSNRVPLPTNFLAEYVGLRVGQSKSFSAPTLFGKNPSEGVSAGSGGVALGRGAVPSIERRGRQQEEHSSDDESSDNSNDEESGEEEDADAMDEDDVTSVFK